MLVHLRASLRFLLLFVFGFYTLAVSTAFAAWPDSFEHRVQALEALRYDMVWPGMIHDDDEVARRYETSCSTRAGTACRYEEWQGDRGGDLELASEVFSRRCGNEPLSCTVMGWAAVIDEQGRYVDDQSAGRTAARYFTRACREKAYAPGCSALGELHLRGLGVDQDMAEARSLFEEACTARDYWGCYQLGNMNLEGLGEDRDLTVAYELYSLACSNRVPHGCVAVAEMVEEGEVVDEDGELAVEMYREACTQKYGGGCSNLGRIYADGILVERSMITAQVFYRTACEGGDLDGCFGLAELYETGMVTGGTPEDAADIYDEACAAGNAGACTRLGRMYIRGRGLPRDLEEGLFYIQRACADDDPAGCDALGWLYENGEGVEMNLTRATTLYTRACDLGEGSGCYHLSQLYAEGKGVDTDTERALELLEQSCDDGYGAACGGMATMYLQGEGGVRRDAQRAVELFQLACDRRHGMSCTKLGYMHENGRGVNQDDDRAFEYYERACSFESGAGCHRLAQAYENGAGTGQNFVLASESYELGCGYGYEDSCAAGESVEFQSRHEAIVNDAFHSDVCQVWSLDPDDPDRTRLVVDVSGMDFTIMAGVRNGQRLRPVRAASTYDTGRVYTARTVWTTGRGRDRLQFEQHEIWRPSDDSIESFPGDQSFSPDRNGDVMIVYSREEEVVRRLRENGRCAFAEEYPMLSTEHCSAMQALLAAQLITECRGD